MPTEHDDDVKISAMLNQADPPKSPEHLDAAILNYAREKATQSAAGQGDRLSWLSLTWLQQNWMPAAATLSVAAIAVSVSLQMFSEPALQSAAKAGLAEFSLNDSAPSRQASLAIEAEEQLRTADPIQSAEPNSLAAGDIAAQPVLQRRQSAAPSLAQSTAAQVQRSAAGVSSTAAQSIEDLVEINSSQAAIESNAAIANDRAEEDIANTASARSGVRRNSALSQELSASFTGTLVEDVQVQEYVVAVLRSSLDAVDQAANAARQDFSSQVGPLVEAYRQLTDPAELLSVQARYAVARSQRLDLGLPDSVEELVSLLETLEN